MPCMGVPTRLGRYVVRRRLGSGGFATVWLAHDEQLDAEVAIKVLADNWGHDDSVRRRFLEEGRFLRRVESEHVVQVHDVGELEDGRPFLVLTYADRGTLADRLKKEPLPLAQAVDVVVQVGRGLQALHRRGLLHRDVKPANVCSAAPTTANAPYCPTSVWARRSTKCPESQCLAAPRRTSLLSRRSASGWTSVPTCTHWARSRTPR